MTRGHAGARIITGLPTPVLQGLTGADTLDQGRQSFARREWASAYAQLSAADHLARLEPEDLEQLAISAYLTGHDTASAELWTRAHHDWIRREGPERAARCAFWLGLSFLMQGESATGAGWIARARRLLDDGRRDCVEQGYLLLPAGIRCVMDGDLNSAYRTFSDAVTIADRFGDANLLAWSRHGKGRALVRQGKIAEGVALLDESIVAITAGDVSAITAGNIYCSSIEACYEIFDLRRAHEWTTALGRWCDAQPDLVLYRGPCLVRRAELLVLHGDWPDALTEAQRARDRLSEPHGQSGVGAAFYQLAEIHRLLGEFPKADDAYRRANQHGRDPQPGLALLRLAQGKIDAAMVAIKRVLDETHDRRIRSRILSAHVEIALAAKDVAAARVSADELNAIARDIGTPFLRAAAAQCQGAVGLAEGDPHAALGPLRKACSIWRELEAPYDAARTGVLVGLACRALGDADAAEMELDSAQTTLRQLGARPDLAKLTTVLRASAPKAGSLTEREVQVIRLVATGRTNRVIAQELRISEKTVARHLSNIFTKLGLSTRAAATAYAYQHHLA